MNAHRIVTCFFALALALKVGSTTFADEKKPNLEKIFSPLREKFGKGNDQKAKIVADPTPIRMLNDKSPGKVWQVALGDVRFKLTIQDKTKLRPEDCLHRLELVPPSYLKMFEIVSEGDKAGAAFYASLGDASAHGSQDYLNMVPNADIFVVLHEAGHILEQRATAADPKILANWKNAIVADKISVSDYGDTVAHEDLAEFACMYAICLDAGKDELAKLKLLSPQRFELWERILRDAKPKK